MSVDACRPLGPEGCASYSYSDSYSPHVLVLVLVPAHVLELRARFQQLCPCIHCERNPFLSNRG